VICEQCGRKVEKPTGHVNRARKEGRKLFCSRRCFGLSRRHNKSDAQKKEEKRLYDMEYRAKNRPMLKVKKAAYFQRTYDPEKAKVERKKRSAAHAEYCRRPEYKAWKKVYDQKYRAKKHYGEFWESFLVLLDLERTVEGQMPSYERKLRMGLLNKKQTRNRHDRKTHSKELEAVPLGNPG